MKNKLWMLRTSALLIMMFVALLPIVVQTNSAQAVTVTYQVIHSWDDRYVKDSDITHPPFDDYQAINTYTIVVGQMGTPSSPKWGGGGMRFQNVQVPQGAKIVSAKLKLYCATVDLDTDRTPCYAKIQGEATDDATHFHTAYGGADYNSRVRTTAKVTWTIPDWAEKTWYDSPDISSVIQEIVDRSGWTSGNDMVIFWEDDATPVGDDHWRNCRTYDGSVYYDGDGRNAPKLEITYYTRVDWALELGKKWLDRMYTEISTTKAVVKDFPSLPLRVYDENANKWYRAGQLDEKVRVETLAIGDVDKANFWFNTDADEELNEPKLYAEYWSIDSETTKARVQMVSCSHATPYNLLVYLGDTLLGRCDTTWTKTVTKTGGYASNQYVTRHSIRMAEKYYRAIGETAKADKLKNFLTAYGYDGKDSYDPLFGASNGYADTFFTDYDTFPDPELWGSLPEGANYHKYGTRLQKAEARNFWCDYIEEATPRYESLYALHLLNKYGSSKLSTAKAYIDSAGWDGFGCRREVTVLGQTFVYNSYPTYILPCFLGAVSKYASMTNDPTYLQMADEVAGVVLTIQWKYPSQTAQYGTLYKADHVGGFMTGYMPSGSAVWQPTWEPITDAFFWILDSFGYWQLSPYESPTPVFTNSECTILCLQGLRLYKQLLPNRTPKMPTKGINLVVNIADDIISQGGGFYYNNKVDKRGKLESTIQSTLGTGAWSKVGLKFNFKPDVDISYPEFTFALQDIGAVVGDLYGWAKVTQCMTLWDGATSLFSVSQQIHYAGATESEITNCFHKIVYDYSGTLSKTKTYTVEILILLESGNGGYVCYSPSPTHYAEALWITIDS